MPRPIGALGAIVLCFLSPVSASAAATCAPEEEDVAGFYVLNGEMEVGSQLLLLADGRFEFMLAYGAIDQYGTGCWSLSEQALSLRIKGRNSVPSQHSPENRKFRGMTLILEQDGRLSWPLPGFRGKYERQ